MSACSRNLLMAGLLLACRSVPAAEPTLIPVDPEHEEPPLDDVIVLETIEVTASKRAKAARDLPGSVGAISGALLEEIHAQALGDYLKFVPGVGLVDYGSGRQIPVIRGIAASTDPPGWQFAALTTGIFIDDMPFADTFLPLSMPDLHPFDLERVEVLKGPQGTLFGAGALAGAIRYILEKPKHGVAEVKLTTTVSRTPHAETLSNVAGAAVNVPLSEDFAVRIVGLFRDEAGWYDARPNGGNRRDEDDVDGLDQRTVRILSHWAISDDLTISAFHFDQQTELDDLGGADQPLRPERDDAPFASPFTYGIRGTNLSATYQLRSAQLMYSANALRKDSYDKGQAESQTPDQLGSQQEVSLYNLNTAKISGTTHELRLASLDDAPGPWEWLVGGAYMNHRHFLFQFIPLPGDADSGYYADPPEQPSDVSEQDQMTATLWDTLDGHGTEVAAFGEVTRRLGDHFEVTAGARWFDIELVNEMRLRGATILAFFPGQTERVEHGAAGGKGLNPKLALRYLHDDHIQAYALVAKGYQFGGFQLNPPVPGLREGTERKGFHFGPYDSSTLWNHEAGVRTEWLDGRVRFDMTAFYLDWTDLQLNVQMPINPEPIPAPDGSGIPQDPVALAVTVNVGSAHSEGLEATLEAAPFRGARFTSAVAWIDARTDVPFDESNPRGPVPAGTRLPGTPPFQWVNAITYGWTLGTRSPWEARLGVAHVHVGASPNTLRRTRDVGGYSTLDLRASVSPTTGWLPGVSLALNNVTDVRGVTAYAGDGSTVHSYYFVRPRTALLSLDWRY